MSRSAGVAGSSSEMPIEPPSPPDDLGVPIEALRAIQPYGQQASAPRDIDSAWQRVMATMARSTEPSTGRAAQHGIAPGDRKRGPFAVRLTLGIAATCGIIGALLFATKQSSFRAESRARMHAAPVGVVVVVPLPNGSRVTLAPLTTLRVRGTELELDGEGYFQIQHDARAPITVRTGAITTRVLGTSFVVRRYQNDAATHVVVVDGRVSTGGQRRAAILSAGMAALVSDSTVRTSAAAAQDVNTDWIRGQLMFKDVPAATVLEALGRWYGYEFRMTDSTLARERVTVRFRAGARDETFEAIGRLLGVSLSVDGRIVTLRPRVMIPRARPRREVPETVQTSTEVGK
jgi:ferric-dicitrate binding protein FerR (iron transport regulator)